MQIFSNKQALAMSKLSADYAALKARSDLLDNACGVGLWEAVLHKGDAMDPQSRWTWSPEFRRLIGYSSEADYPNVVQSWSDRLHPDDVAPTFAAFTGHLVDKSGRSRYEVVYRLKVRDGSYRWFRATGGCAHQPDGSTILACGSLTDIHDQKSAEIQAVKDAEADTFAIQALGQGLAAIVSGNLEYRLEEQLSPKLERLKTDFNQAIQGLSKTLNAVVRTAQTVGSGSQEISTATDDLSRRTEQQAASLEESAAALSEITGTVKKTSEGARHARDVVGAAKKDAEQSGVIVRRAVEAMGEIERSSGQIGQIISVIDEIAFQTNLLALNAGVEAARAGDAGRGFAVVASEVRALAQRSAAAAKEIKSLINASSQHVASGVGLVGQTGKSLEGIMTRIGDLNEVITVIAASAVEQATALDQINTAVVQMDQVTQQNAAMVEEATAASRNLAREADQLAHLVARFETGHAAAVEHPAPPARRPAARPTAGLTSLKTVGRGGAVRKPVAAAAADESWEEF